jgi:nitric oxide reductase activation protein
MPNPQPNRLPDANQQMEMREQQAKQQNFDAANAERKKQIAEDSAKLLKLATELKAEVDKTTKDTLSLNVIRKADEIEKLAHGVKEKMKLTIGGS